MRLVRLLCLGLFATFLAYAQLYRVDGAMVRAGRQTPASWMLWKAQHLDLARLRPEGGHVAWLVGSSILRESFDEVEVNRILAERGSRWRVAKFGQTRGATGLSAPLLDWLPIAPGDRIVHGVSPENLHRRWLDFSNIPPWQVAMLYRDLSWWQIAEWTPQEKLELLAGWPRDYWSFQEDAMAGWLRMLKRPWAGVPRPRKATFTLTFHTWEFHQDLVIDPDDAEASNAWLGPEQMDTAPGQFNVDGLARMRATAAERGAELHLIDIPPRQSYLRHFLAPEVRNLWDQWRIEQPELSYFPQLPDAFYYDTKHPNFRGRAILSRYMADWLDHPTPGRPTPLRPE